LGLPSTMGPAGCGSPLRAAGRPLIGALSWLKGGGLWLGLWSLDDHKDRFDRTMPRGAPEDEGTHGGQDSGGRWALAWDGVTWNDAKVQN